MRTSPQRPTLPLPPDFPLDNIRCRTVGRQEALERGPGARTLRFLTVLWPGTYRLFQTRATSPSTFKMVRRRHAFLLQSGERQSRGEEGRQDRSDLIVAPFSGPTGFREGNASSLGTDSVKLCAQGPLALLESRGKANSRQKYSSIKIQPHIKKL